MLEQNPEKEPDPPKAATPLPHSEQQEIVGPVKNAAKNRTAEDEEKPKEKELR